MKNILDKIALAASALFSPYLVIAVFSLITIFYHSPNTSEFFAWAGIYMTFTIVAPVLYMLWLVKSKKITDVHVFVRGQRNKPFAAAIIGAVITLILFYIIKTPVALIAMSWAVLINGIVFALLTQFWKVSIHAASFASSLTIVAMLVSLNWLVLSPLLILVIWSRYYRKRNTWTQLITASILSPIITYIIIRSII